MYYVFDDGKNKFEGMTREQIMSAIAQATGITPSDADTGYITTIKEQNANKGIALWVGTQHEYNAISTPDENTLYCITDPNETAELQNEIEQLRAQIAQINAQATSEIFGWTIETQTAQAALENNQYQHSFTVPENYTLIEASFSVISTLLPSLRIWQTEQIAVLTGTTSVTLMAAEISDVANVEFKIVYAKPSQINLSELTDIRVGVDGYTYQSAGEAVRQQLNEKFELPANGEAGQQLVSDGHGGAAWIDIDAMESTDESAFIQKTFSEDTQIFPVATINTETAISALKVNRAGINLLPQTKRVVNTGVGRIDYYGSSGDDGLYLPAGTYTLFYNWTPSGYVSLYVWDIANYGTDTRLAYATSMQPLTFTLNEPHYCAFRAYRANDIPATAKLGICVGDTAPTDWEDYNGVIYTIPFGESVTNGIVNLYSKTLTVDGVKSTLSDVPRIYALEGLNNIWCDDVNDFYIIYESETNNAVREEICGEETTSAGAMVVVDADEGDVLNASVSVSNANSVTVHCCGENFLDPSKKATTNDRIEYHASDGGLYLPAGTYTLCLSNRAVTVSGLYVNDMENSAAELFHAYSANTLTFTLAQAARVRLRAYKNGIDTTMSLCLVRGGAAPIELPAYAGAVTTKTLEAATTGDVNISFAAVNGKNFIWSEEGNIAVTYIPTYQATIRRYANSDAIEKAINAERACNPNFFSCAHRGGKYVVPECTAPAMIFAKQQGFTAVENDVNKTSDGVFVMYHDSTLAALGYSSVNIRESTYAQLLNYDFGAYVSDEFAGTAILTFEEWLSCCMKLGLRPVIDFKINPSNDNDWSTDIASLVGIVKKLGMLRKVTWFGNLTIVQSIRAIDARADVFMMGAPYVNGDTTALILTGEDDPHVGFNVELDSLTSAMIETAHNNGFKISAWTNNEYLTTASDLLAQVEPFVDAGLEWLTVNNYAVDKMIIAKYLQ